MTKSEQTFATALKNQLIKQQFPQSALIEVKIAAGNTFYPSDLRPSQMAVIRKMAMGLPLGHKISDSGIGSKFVDLIYINPNHIGAMGCFVAIKFIKSKQAYMVPLNVCYQWTFDNALGVKEYRLQDYKFNFRA